VLGFGDPATDFAAHGASDDHLIRLKPMVAVAQLLKRHLPNLLTYLKHPITNAVTEGLNSKIQSLKSAARGFRNFQNYRTRILFFCGKLELYPL
jgi:transposase